MSTFPGDLVTTTTSTATSINYAGQSQLIADGKLDAAETGQTGDYHLEDRTRYRIQDTESIQSLWSNGAWTETGHNFTVDHEAHDAWVYNQTVNLPKNSDPIITNNPDGSTSTQINKLGQDQSTVTSAGGYDYHLVQSGTPKDFVFSLNHTSQSQSGKHDTGTWRAADGTSGATYDNLGSETKGSRANLSGRVQNGSVYYTGIDVYQTRNTSTNNTGSGFALGQTTNSHTVGSTQTTETRGGNSGSWYGSKLESGNSTTNYTTVSGTMGQPFSGMTQTGFNMTTLYGTAALTGITGMYGYGQTGTGGSYNTLQTGGSGTPGPVQLLPMDGEPGYSTAGEYSGSQPGVVSGSVTPVSNKINFGDPRSLFLGMDPRNPYSCNFNPKAANYYHSENEEANARLILKNQIHEWRKLKYWISADLLEYFLNNDFKNYKFNSKGEATKLDFVFTNQNKIEMSVHLRKYISDLVNKSVVIMVFRGEPVIFGSYLDNENGFHARWFSEEKVKSIPQMILNIKSNELWFGKDERFFNAFGGANLKIIVQNAILSPDKKTVDLTLSVTVSDTYTFPPGYFGERLIFESYNAAHYLENIAKTAKQFRYSNTSIFTIGGIKTGLKIW
jgi:hypothetical protein